MKGSKPDTVTVSVVIPTYNRRDFVGDAITSVLSQTRRPDEVLVVDDGSTDNTARLVEEQFGARVVYLRQDNKERGAARNLGVRTASGSHVAFLDSDDCWLPNHLAVATDVIERLGPSIVFSQLEFRDKDLNQLVSRPPATRFLTTGELVKGRSVTPSCVVAARSSLLELDGFSEDRLMSGFEDWHLWVRASVKQALHPVNQVTVQLRQHAGRSITQAAVFTRAYRRAVEALLEEPRYHESLRPYARRLRFYCNLGLAHSHSSEGEYGIAGKLLCGAVRCHPAGVASPALWSAAAKVILRRRTPWRAAEKRLSGRV